MAGIYKKLDGVAKKPAPKINFGKKTLTLSYDPKKLTEEKLVAALKGSRYTASPIKKKEKKEEKK